MTLCIRRSRPSLARPWSSAAPILAKHAQRRARSSDKYHGKRGLACGQLLAQPEKLLCAGERIGHMFCPGPFAARANRCSMQNLLELTSACLRTDARSCFSKKRQLHRIKDGCTINQGGAGFSKSANRRAPPTKAPCEARSRCSSSVRSCLGPIDYPILEGAEVKYSTWVHLEHAMP
jgi:hypothetical protein